MFTFELAELMKPKGIAVNCLDPGTVNTKMLLAGQCLLFLQHHQYVHHLFRLHAEV